MIIKGLRLLLALFMLGAGVMHFANAEFFVRMVPKVLGDPLVITWITGVMELALGVGLLVPKTRRVTSWLLMAFFVAVFPANVNMALNPAETGAADLPPAALFLRLPLQLVLIAWAWWVGRPDPEPLAKPLK